jgi:hypothetical protein
MRAVTTLIRADDLTKLVHLAILTGKVKNAQRVSMVIVGDTETGKSELLSVFMNLKSVIWANDLSGKIVVDVVAPEVEKGKTHIVIPDFLKVLSHQKVVVANTVTMLSSGMEEGIKNMMFYGMQREFKKPVKFGVITAITREAYRLRERYWKSIGFVGRCIPVSYSHSEKTQLKIHDHIKHGFPARTIVLLSRKPGTVEIRATEAEEAQKIAKSTKPFSTGYRFHKQIRALCQANALARGSPLVSRQDVEEIKHLSRFININFTPI